MRREFDYADIEIKNIEDNKHLIFICDGDDQKVIIESEKSNEYK